MKPGQDKLQRQYYDKATHEVPSGKTVLSNYQRFKSTYDKHHNDAVGRGDYVVPDKSQNNMSKLYFYINSF